MLDIVYCRGSFFIVSLKEFRLEFKTHNFIAEIQSYMCCVVLISYLDTVSSYNTTVKCTLTQSRALTSCAVGKKINSSLANSLLSANFLQIAIIAINIALFWERTYYF
jgi:hypothetical protein